MLHLRGKAVEEDRKDSGEEQRDEDEGLGPRSNVSLLDQHQHLKEKAEGGFFMYSIATYMLLLLYCKVDIIQRCLTCLCAYSSEGVCQGETTEGGREDS